jgi:chlorobactene glucosyltransferase
MTTEWEPAIRAHARRPCYVVSTLIAWAIFILYVLVGPIAWQGLYVAGLFAARRMGKLHETIEHQPDLPLPSPAPSVSVVVPVKDEAAGILACIDAALAQRYVDGAFEVVTINDRSTDGTGEFLASLSAQPVYRALRVMHILRLPAGWLGKCHALHVATRGLSSDWLLFVDSDVKLKSPDVVRQAIAVCEQRGWDALSIMPTLRAQSFVERLLLPLLAACWAIGFRISMTNDDTRPHIAAANGQFFLVRRSWYERVGDHECVKDRIVEDVELMRTLKRAGAKVRFQFGQELAEARMHATLDEIYRGWARILSGTTGRRVLPLAGVVAWIVVCGLGVVPALLAGVSSTRWQVASLLHLWLMIFFAARVYHASRQSVLLSLLLPLSLPALLSVYANAIRTCLTGRVRWRGSEVDVR